ncbi:MAG: hypothetical protein ABIB41_06580 [Nitrospirota bacterium]
MLTQAEADALFAMPKKPKSSDSLNFPHAGGKLLAEFISLDGREVFLFNINRASIAVSKCTYQKRARQVEILRRLDIDGSPHPNPAVETVPLEFLVPYNGLEIPCPHLHIYVEGFADKWAIPAPTDLMNSNADLYTVMESFLKYCNVQEMPNIERGLFI